MLNDDEWLAEQFEALPDRIRRTSPSEWAEQNRYLPASVTPMPGPFSFDVAPYLREILDCMDVRSPVREVTVMKGSQICMTVGVLENFIGYAIGEVRTAPIMFVTATDDLVKVRLDKYITPMIEQSGLADVIASTDTLSKRKSGKTDKQVSWYGGGFMIPTGANGPAMLRSISVRFALEDEIDGWPMSVGGEGDPVALVEKRTDAYAPIRKLLRISTPLEAGSSRIKPHHDAGDRRKFHVPCLECGEFQELRFEGRGEHGVLYGITYDLKPDGETLVPGSVRYVCKFCGHAHTNSNKGPMLRAGKWVATREADHPTFRSYHINALYSPAGMLSWESVVMGWLKAWDVAQHRPRSVDLLRVFYNTVLGEVYEDRGTKVTLAGAKRHRLSAYRFGEIPNQYMQAHAGGPAQIVLCTVDVHKESLRVAVFAFSPNESMFLLDYHTYDGDTERLDDAATWGKLKELIVSRVYIADDGRRYRVARTFVDAGYQSKTVYQFCKQWAHGVTPIAGRAGTTKGQLVKEFQKFTTSAGTVGAHIAVDFFKDELSAVLKRKWDGEGTMPPGHFIAPAEVSDEQLKELTVEYKKMVFDKKTGHKKGVQWIRPSGAANELWDLCCYARGGLAIVAHSVMVEHLELDEVDMPAFWRLCEERAMYWSPPLEVDAAS